MGVDVDPEVMIGISFNSENEVKEYIEDVFGLKEEHYEGSLAEIEYIEGFNLSWQEESGYGDNGGVLGIHVMPSDLKYKSNKVDEIWEKLYMEFPQEDHDKIDVHMWARYW